MKDIKPMQAKASSEEEEKEQSRAEYDQESYEALLKLIRGRLHKHPFAQLLGQRVESLSYQKAVVSLRTNESHLNPNGVVHGGVLMSLADNAAGSSVLYTGQVTPTLDLHYRFLRPVYAGDKVYAYAEVVQAGLTIVVIQVKLYVDDNLIGDATAAFYKNRRRGREVSAEVFARAEEIIRKDIRQTEEPAEDPSSKPDQV